jgi:hypothetical protein
MAMSMENNIGTRVFSGLLIGAFAAVFSGFLSPGIDAMGVFEAAAVAGAVVQLR